MKLLELCGAKFDIVLKEKNGHVSRSWCVGFPTFGINHEQKYGGKN
jgi:hypothetical protein